MQVFHITNVYQLMYIVFQSGGVLSWTYVVSDCSQPAAITQQTAQTCSSDLPVPYHRQQVGLFAF